MNTFPDWLMAELERKNMSQSDLARAARIQPSSISDILSGRRKVGKNLAVSIAKGLKIPPEEVFREAGLLPKTKESKQTKWIERIRHKLEGIENKRDQELIEKIIDLLSPDQIRREAHDNEGSS